MTDTNALPNILSIIQCDNELIAAAIIIHDLELEFKEFDPIVTTLLLFRGISDTGTWFKPKDVSFMLMDCNEDSFIIHAKHDNGKTVEVVIERE